MQHKKGIAITALVAAFMIMLFAGVFVWMMASGRLMWANEAPQLSSSQIVCGNDIVKLYNEASIYVQREGSEVPIADTKSLDSLVVDLKGRPNYENDPTCQTILFWTAIDQQDYEASRAAYQKVNDLFEKNLFANSNLRGNSPLFMYEPTFQMLSPEAQQSEGLGDGA